MRYIRLATIFLILFIVYLFFISFILYKIDPNIKTYFDALWYSIVTVSTVGYGDIIPKLLISKILVLSLIILGVIAVSLFTAIVTSKMIEKKIFYEEDLSGMKNHIVLCGYKPNVKVLIKDLVKSEKVVLINFEKNSEINVILENFDVKFIEGDYTEEEILKKASIEFAKKAIVLSNENEDSNVLATVILLKSLNPNLYVIAEIHNPKFENYLKKVKCDEVILIEEYSKYLILKAINNPGVSNILDKLLKDDSIVIVYDEKYFYKKFIDLFEEFLAKNYLLLGVIENYSSYSHLKELKIEKFRALPDIENLPKEIEEIKNLEINRVRFDINKDYVIPEFCALILLKR